MSYSPTLSVETSTLSQLWNSFRIWEQSVSLDESITRLGDFISTCFAISDGSFAVEKQISLMYSVVTPMCRLLEAHRSRVVNTQSRMAMLYVEDLSTQSSSAELEMGRLAIYGLRLRVRRIENRFGTYAMHWIPKLLRLLSLRYPNTVTGNMQLPFQSTLTLSDLDLKAEQVMAEISGYYSLELDLENHV